MYIIALAGLALDHYLLTIFSTVLLVASGTCIYNVFFHPLRNFPGPLLGSISDFYKVYLFASKKIHLKSTTLHEKYGPVVRIAPNLLSINHFDLLPHVYYKGSTKTPFYSTGIAGEVAPLLQIQGNQDHVTSLKIIAPSLSMRNVKDMEDKVDERISEVMEKLSSKCATTNSAIVDVSNWIRWYVYDTLCQLVYSQHTGMVRQERDVNSFIRSWHGMFWFGGLVGTLPWLVHPIITCPPFKYFLMPRKGHRSGSGYIMSMHEKIFAKSADLVSKSKSIRRVLLETRRLTAQQVQHQCYLTVVAGQDTTAALISSLIDHLLKHPESLERVKSELSNLPPSNSKSSPIVQYEELSDERTPYFNACVMETLRVTPPTPIPLPRYVSEGGLRIDDTQWIPEGTEIAANPYLIGRNKRLYGEDANEFNPERWLGDSEKTRMIHKYDFAWGYGDRRCIGKSLALFETKKFVVELLRRFDVSAIQGHEPTVKNVGIFLFKDQKIRLDSKLAA